MADDPTHSPEAPDVEAADVEAADDDASEDLYELNLDEPADIDEAFKDAVAAVDRAKEGDAGTAADRKASGRGPRRDATGGSPPEDEASAEAAGLRERLMRTLADFDNYRKRTEREKQSLRRFANFDVFKDFLGVLDNLERAMDSSGSTEDLKQGLRMIIRQQEEILRRHGVERVEAVGKPFDPTVHEAVAREETAEVSTPTVTKEMQRGYLLHDRLLRPAMVFVAMPGDRSAGGGAEGEGEASS